MTHGADVNAENDDGDTALIVAAAEGHDRVFALLLEQDVDVNAKTFQKAGNCDFALNASLVILKCRNSFLSTPMSRVSW